MKWKMLNQVEECWIKWKNIESSRKNIESSGKILNQVENFWIKWKNVESSGKMNGFNEGKLDSMMINLN